MLRLKSEFDYVRSTNFKIQTRSTILLVSDSPDNKMRFGVICGRKFNKNAVVRNRAKRLIKESIRRIKFQIPLRHILFIPKKGICSLKAWEVQGQIIEALKNNNLWLPPEPIRKGKGYAALPIIGLIKIYQFLTPWLKCCRFHPSCSEYTIQALKMHGLFKGMLLSVYRIARCHPYCKSGYDPVPEKFSLKFKYQGKEKK